MKRARDLRLREAVSIKDFLSDPFGRFFASTNFASWCAGPTLCGTVSFGQFSRAEMGRLLETLDFVRHPKMRRYQVLVDMRRLVIADPLPYQLLNAYVEKDAAFYAKMIERHATVLPQDPFSGLVVSGFVKNFGFESEAFVELPAAIEWLDQSLELSHLVDHVYYIATSPSHRLNDLRRSLADSYATASLPQTARALGVSTATLQRTLRAAGTDFTNELRTVRLGVAERLLEKGELKVSAVGREVGYDSAAHFGRLFKERYGVTPEERRAQRFKRPRG